MPKGLKLGGRTKGTPNKIPADLKAQILEAAKLAGGEGGTIAYLKKQAVLNPGPFMALLGKILPTQVTGPNNGPIQHQHETSLEKLTDRLDGIAARIGEEGFSVKLN